MRGTQAAIFVWSTAAPRRNSARDTSSMPRVGRFTMSVNPMPQPDRRVSSSGPTGSGTRPEADIAFQKRLTVLAK